MPLPPQSVRDPSPQTVKRGQAKAARQRLEETDALLATIEDLTLPAAVPAAGYGPNERCYTCEWATTAVPHARGECPGNPERGCWSCRASVRRDDPLGLCDRCREEKRTKEP